MSDTTGMRFALLEAKLALMKTLLSYRLVKCAKTLDKPDMSKAGVLLSSNSVYVGVEKL